MLTHFSLFTGIGGVDLSAEWAGFTTVGQCEWADYPTKVLEKHWPDVPRWRDIRELTYDKFVERTGLRTVDLISGGFPCQPFSVAGKQKGKRDDRYLWPEMLRVIREFAPSWVLGENVPGILSIAGKTVCEDLEREGYAVTVFNFEAAAVGAKHRRDRVFFVGYAEHNGLSSTAFSGFITKDARKGTEGSQQTIQPARANIARSNEDVADASSKRGRRIPVQQGRSFKANFDTDRSSENVAYSNIKGMERCEDTGCIGGSGENGNEYAWRCCEGAGTWTVEPNVGRVANGVPSRVDRLKCLGNAVVPQQVYPILKAIAEIERGD